MSSASSNSQSNGLNLGLLNIHNTVSNAQSHATSASGTTSANAGSGSSATQTLVPTRIDNVNPSQQNENLQRPPGSFLPNPSNPFLGGNLFSNPYQHQQQQYPYQYQQQQQQHQYPNQHQQQYPNQYQQQFVNPHQRPFNQYPNQYQQYQQPYGNQQYPNQFGIMQMPFRPPQMNNNPFINPIGLMNNNYQPPGAQQFIQKQNEGLAQLSAIRNSDSGLGNGFDDVLKNPAPVTSAPPTNTPLLGTEIQNILNGAAAITAKPIVNKVDNDAAGAEYGLDVRIDEDEKKMRKRRSPEDAKTESRFGEFGWPQQQFNPYQSGQQNANANGLAQNQNPFGNQQAGTNTHSANQYNPFGNFQNNGEIEFFHYEQLHHNLERVLF